MRSADEGTPNTEEILAHFGEENKLWGAVTPPIFQNSLFVFDKTEDLVSALSGISDDSPFVYSRISNPTVQVVEKKIAALEGMDACKVTSGGIGAITAALSSEVQSGAHVIMVESAYSPARSYLKYLERFGVTHDLVEGSNASEVLDLIKPNTTAIYLESPSSLVLKMQDIPLIAAEAKQRKITTLIDNTYCTPLFMRPAEFGVDIVLHSASKYLGGHSDINAGAICASKEKMRGMLTNEINFFGNLLHPFSSWLLLRGLRTLKIRLNQHRLAADYVAPWLETQPQIERVHHISLASYPQKALYEKLMSGSGGLFSFEPKNQNRQSVMNFCDALKIFERGISWGGFESLVVPSFVNVTESEKRWVIRLFCGLESPEDLKIDIQNALPQLS